MKKIVFSLLALTLLSTSAYAAGTSFQIVSGRSVEIGTVIGNTDSLEFPASTERCYCCELSSHSSIGSGVRFGNATVTGGGNPNITVSQRGRAEPRISNSPADISGAARACFTITSDSPDTTHTVIFDIQAGLAGNDTANNVVAKCYETTLYGGFNTSVTDFNFLEITNTLKENQSDNGVISGTVVARNAINDTTIVNLPFSVNPGDRLDIDIHSAAGSGVFGPVSICHNGPGKSVQAVVNQYRIISQSPLDFTPVSQSVLQTIGGSE